MVGTIIFAALLILGIGFFSWNISKIVANIKLGRDVDRSDKKAERWKTMILVALGQKKMFSRPIPALLHLMLYSAFIITQIELIEIVVDGLTAEHRYFRSAL